MLLLGHVFLVVNGGDAVFVGELRHADPVAGLRAVRGRGGWRGAGLLLGLAQPQQDGPKDEDSSGRDADDDGPGQAAGRGRGHRCAGRFGICTWWQGRDRKSSLNAGKGDSKQMSHSGWLLDRLSGNSARPSNEGEIKPAHDVW